MFMQSTVFQHCLQNKVEYYIKLKQILKLKSYVRSKKICKLFYKQKKCSFLLLLASQVAS